MSSGRQSVSSCDGRAAVILDGLDAAVRAELRLEIAAEVDSTNEVVKRRCTSGADIHGLALLADRQSAGRGRLGKPWFSPPDSNLYLSLGWRFDSDTCDLAGLSLAVGCAIAEQLQDSMGVDIRLKWPNDLYIAGMKVGGILIDIVPASGEGWQLVVGVGLNVAMPRTDAIDQPWTDLAAHLKVPPSRDDVAGDVLLALTSMLSDWPTAGFLSWREVWQRRDFLVGNEVAVQHNGAALVGVAMGVDSTGALTVDTDSGVVSVHAGEASMLRRASS